MASLSLQHIYKVYDNGVKQKKGAPQIKPAVSDFCMEIEDKEFIVFVGPSGCGKSTTLRMIAGLEEITAGDLYIDERLVNDVEPKDRDIAMVFQNYALYPHMSVYENMAFGLKLRKIADIKKNPDGSVFLDKEGNEVPIMRHYNKQEIDERVLKAAEILDITEYLDRKPKALSGGQRQRVALGRAIVRNPKVFLLDEPLSNLDAKLRADMRTEITKLHDKLQTTFIYVTHDQVEAMTMGSRIVVMKDGFIKQVDTPQNLYDFPANKFVASFIGTPQMNFYDGEIDNKGHITFANGQTIELPKDKLDMLDLERIGSKTEIVLGIRPEDFHRSDDSSAKITCRIDVLEELGSESILYGNLDLTAETGVTSDDNAMSVVAKLDARTTFTKGEHAVLSINLEHLHIFQKSNEISLLKKYSELAKEADKQEQPVIEEEAKEE